MTLNWPGLGRESERMIGAGEVARGLQVTDKSLRFDIALERSVLDVLVRRGVEEDPCKPWP